MQFANDKDGKRFYIKEADENAQYYCPSCNAPMTQRRGQINIPHFAHMKGHLCSDNWNYEMSEWHLSWQNNYPLDNQEVVVSNDGKIHRADVLINDTVIEFQHSPLSTEEFQERNAFYTACGYHVIWLFDAREAYQTTLINDKYYNNVYRWKHPPKTITGLDLKGNIQVYFHLCGEEKEENGVVVRLISYLGGDLHSFCSAPSERYTETEFYELTCNGSVKRETDLSRKDELCHTLYIVRQKSGGKDCFDCPIYSETESSLLHKHYAIPCEQCQYCKVIDWKESTVRCSGRYRDYFNQIRTVLDKRLSSDGKSYTVSYIACDGTIQEFTVNNPKSPVKSIMELAKEYNTGVLDVQNVRTGYRFRIERSVEEMIAKYNRVFGYIWYSHLNRWSNDSREIFGPQKAEWIAV